MTHTLDYMPPEKKSRFSSLRLSIIAIILVICQPLWQSICGFVLYCATTSDNPGGFLGWIAIILVFKTPSLLAFIFGLRSLKLRGLSTGNVLGLLGTVGAIGWIGIGIYEVFFDAPTFWM
jgi:hypothetical protein